MKQNRKLHFYISKRTRKEKKIKIYHLVITFEIEFGNFTYFLYASGIGVILPSLKIIIRVTEVQEI